MFANSFVPLRFQSGIIYSVPPLLTDVFRQWPVLIIQDANTMAFDSRTVRGIEQNKVVDLAESYAELDGT